MLRLYDLQAIGLKWKNTYPGLLILENQSLIQNYLQFVYIYSDVTTKTPKQPLIEVFTLCLKEASSSQPVSAGSAKGKYT